jgi:integrase
MAAKRRGHNEGSIRQRADGTWEARLSLPNGKRRSLYAKTRKETQDKLRAAQRDLDAGLDLAAERQTMGQYLARWLSASVRPSVNPKTYEGYESIVRVQVVPRPGARRSARACSYRPRAGGAPSRWKGTQPARPARPSSALHRT